MRRIRVDRLPEPGERLVLDPGASHHLLVVCRHPRGAPVVVFDGAGREADAVLVEVAVADGRQVATVELRSAPRAVPPPAPLHLVLGIPKGPALDSALRMAVEVGVTHLHPVLTARSVPRGERIERWQRIVVGAAQQCGRADLPVLEPLRDLLEAVDRLGPEVDRRVAVPGAEEALRAGGPAALAVGPEGGLTAREIDALLERGWSAVGLGPHVLRVDTAVAVGLASIAARPRAPAGASAAITPD